MGAVLQTAGVAELAAELTCCACSSVCGLITRDSATRAKFRYCSFLLIATVTCVIVLVPGLRYQLDRVPNLCAKTISSDTCDKLVGFSACYRILVSLAVFHAVLALLTVRVTRVKSFRARFNNGLWFFKMALIFGLTVLAFAVPKKSNLFRVWMYIAMTAGFMFIMFQIILIIDFGHSWSVSWAEKLDGGYTRLWYAAMAFVTIFMFALSGGALLAFYMYFTPITRKCHANLFYISFVGLQCTMAAFVSVVPSVQQELEGSGLLQSSVVILYTMYLTWNTLSSEPDATCNPLGNIILEYDSLTGLSGEAIFGCTITLVLLFFACSVRASTSHLGKYGLALAESEMFALETYKDDKAKSSVEKQLETGEKEVSLGEYVGYNYSFFHLIMCLASLYILMVLTNWHSPEENSDLQRLVKSWSSVWVQMASSFVCILIYVWFLVTPLIKRVWGPVFGIIMEEDDPFFKPRDPYMYEKVAQHDSPVRNTAVINEENEPRISPKRRKKDERHKSPRDNKPCKYREEIPSDSNTKPQKLKRTNSVDSNYSAVSFSSNVTIQRTKRKTNTVNADNDETISVVQHTTRENQLTPENIQKRASSEYRFEDESVVSNRSRRNHKKRSLVDSENSQDVTIQIIERPDSKREKSHVNRRSIVADDTTLDVRKRTRYSARPENNQTITKRENNQTLMDDQAVEVASLVPTVFSQREQDPETAREILRLQWKILRAQAKVVKVQERIIKLQQACEVVGEPSAHSSVVAGYISRKEQG